MSDLQKVVDLLNDLIKADPQIRELFQQWIPAPEDSQKRWSGVMPMYFRDFDKLTVTGLIHTLSRVIGEEDRIISTVWMEGRFVGFKTTAIENGDYQFLATKHTDEENKRAVSDLLEDFKPNVID